MKKANSKLIGAAATAALASGLCSAASPRESSAPPATTAAAESFPAAAVAGAKAAAASGARRPADGAERFSLAAAVDRALGRSPAISRAQEGVREAEAGLSEARLSRLPRLSAKSAFLRGDDPVFAFSSLLDQRRFGARNFAVGTLNNPGYFTDVKSSLEVGVPLFTGFELSNRRELARLGLAAAGAEEEASVQSGRYRAVEAYFRLMLGEALLENATARIDSAAAEIADARRLRERGLVLGSDFYAAEAVLGGLEASRARVQGDLAAARSTLRILMGASTGPLETIGSLEEARYGLGPLPELTEAALRQRRDVRQAAIGESAAGVLKEQASLSLLPRVDAFAAIETDTRDFGANPSNRIAGLRAEIPLGDPTYFQRRARAASSERAARAGKRSLEEAVRIEVEEKYHGYQGVLGTQPILRESVEKAEKSLELFRPLYREGRQSILEVLRAEDALAKAKAAYLETLFQGHVGWARLQLAAGLLDSRAVREMDGRLGGPR